MTSATQLIEVSIMLIRLIFTFAVINPSATAVRNQIMVSAAPVFFRVCLKRMTIPVSMNGTEKG